MRIYMCDVVRVRRIKNVCLCTRVSVWCMRVRIPCVNVDYVHRVVYIACARVMDVWRE